MTFAGIKAIGLHYASKTTSNAQNVRSMCVLVCLFLYILDYILHLLNLSGWTLGSNHLLKGLRVKKSENHIRSLRITTH